jgi:hypothetical protein
MVAIDTLRNEHLPRAGAALRAPNSSDAVMFDTAQKTCQYAKINKISSHTSLSLIANRSGNSTAMSGATLTCDKVEILVDTAAALRAPSLGGRGEVSWMKVKRVDRQNLPVENDNR